ncbi:MAG TPA: FG-GAP-like repeat-containing protein, partial [Candidatus Thalassarchaeaceae archaeon]|nr:FG-GAP-like repeat-containing protein [Candidatus Thalassarchaeaceae archaeon]
MNKARVKALALVALMVLSTSLAAMDVAASNSKQYPVTRNPLDLATGDFDCDGDDDIVTASEMGNFLSILWNDGGTYQDRSDIWVSNNNTRRAGFTSIADVGGVEVGDIDDDGKDDIVFYQGNIQVFGSAEVIRGNLTVLTNDDCTGAFTEDAVYTMGDIVWEFQIADVNGDGVDDIVALELQDLASGTQRLLTYLGGSQRNNAATNHKITTLDLLSNKVYSDLRLGNLGEAVAGGPISTDCDDLDAFVFFRPGFNQATG